MQAIIFHRLFPYLGTFFFDSAWGVSEQQGYMRCGQKDERKWMRDVPEENTKRTISVQFQ
jgi:hypothetical protein